MKRDTMPAGFYYVGDLGYVMPDGWWHQQVRDTFYHPSGAPRESPREGRRTIEGITFADFSTGGDGCFEDEWSQSYPVDSGSIGCVRIDDLYSDAGVEYGNVIEFKKDFEVWRTKRALHFGPTITITIE